ncbi:MAG: DUF2344 domain-containing protein [Clostridia bacterium]|nr:DUF2344 domain-containing protein [Clostridia bacterium]
MRDVRIWFSKSGAVKYVSHLDMFRLMTRAVRRADIPLWYTEGYNPHPYISFLQPLPLGVETCYEPLDIRIEGEIKNEEIKDRLNAVMPDGMHIVAVTQAFCKPAEAAYGEYKIVLDAQDIAADDIEKIIQDGALTVEKSAKVKGRKGTKTVDVSAAIHSYSVKTEGDTVVIEVTLPASPELTLNPLQFLESISNKYGTTLYPLSACRIRLLCADMTAFS